jgi:hypothetical protein
MNVAGKIWIALPHRFACGTDKLLRPMQEEHSGQSSARFNKQTMQAIVEDDRDVYAAFAKLPDVTSRNFTARRPSSLPMKIRIIFEVTFNQQTLVTACRSVLTIPENRLNALVAGMATRDHRHHRAR